LVSSSSSFKNFLLSFHQPKLKPLTSSLFIPISENLTNPPSYQAKVPGIILEQELTHSNSNLEITKEKTFRPFRSSYLFGSSSKERIEIRESGEGK